MTTPTRTMTGQAYRNGSSGGGGDIPGCLPALIVMAIAIAVVLTIMATVAR
jgi:hypothetical protein